MLIFWGNNLLGAIIKICGEDYLPHHDWSHPSGRKSRTGMTESNLRQLGELLHKAGDIVPGKYDWEDQGNLDFYLPLNTFNSLAIMFIINIIINR